jgi:pimeloyl-ACP methyl ester carboxylesterase
MNGMGERALWYYDQQGSGRPLILLHAIGMSHAAWNAVIPYLCSTRRVIAFDIAGFGLTPQLPTGMLPTLAHLVESLELTIRKIGIELPVDIAGNSLGGAIALEAAKRGIARSVVAISPPGLWSGHGAPHVKYVFGGLRFLARHYPQLLKATVRSAFLRELALAVPISVGSRHMPTRDALRAVDDLAASPAFEATFKSTLTPLSGGAIAVPVTVAFGDRDWIVLKQWQRRSELPAHTRWVQKRGWGHVPIWVDPVGVAQLILEGTH